MVLSIISGLLCIPLITIAGFGLEHAQYEHNDVSAVFYSVQILVALVQGVVATVTSAYSCRVVCCGKKLTPGQVMFSPTLAQPQMTTNPIIRPPSPHYSAPTNPSSALNQHIYSSAEENPGN